MSKNTYGRYGRVTPPLPVPTHEAREEDVGHNPTRENRPPNKLLLEEKPGGNTANEFTMRRTLKNSGSYWITLRHV